MDLLILDADKENEITATPIAESSSEVTAESTIDAVVANNPTTIADGNAIATVESSAITVPPVTTVPAPIIENILIWPSMQDLNTRLRRVITSYQRNYKKEELKQQQKAKVNLSHYSVHIYYTIRIYRHTYLSIYL